jgi:hypothetical protein
VQWIGLLTALGVGLLIGVVRERRHQPHVSKAGTRFNLTQVKLSLWSRG